MARVSVIMPTFNAACFIDRAIDSVLNQTYADWELLVVDDGSTDDTEDRVKGREDARIKYLYQANQGAACARDLGLKESGGDYAIFLDSDDWWEPDCLGILVGALSRADSSVAVAHADWQYVSGSGTCINAVSSAMDGNHALATLVLRNPIAIHCALTRRAAFETIHGFPVEQPSLEDWELWLRIAVAGYSFVHVPQQLASYYWRTGSKGKDRAKRKAGRLATLQRVWAMKGLPHQLRRVGAQVLWDRLY